MRHAPSTSSRRRLITILAVVGALAVGGAAWAYFTTSGSGTGAAATGTLNPPTSVNAGPASGITVPVTWTASATGGGAVAPQGYYVTRTPSPSGTSVDVCGSSPSSLLPATPTSCNDTTVPNGSYTYTVTAVYHSWSASGTSGSVSVNVAAPTVTGTVIGQASGAAVPGYVQDNAGYYVYANVTDNSGTGIQSVTANLVNVTSGDTAMSLTAGSFTAPGGGSYAYRSGPITSNPSQADGLVHYSVNATDNSARTSTYSNNGSVSFDTSAPTVATPTVTGGYYTSPSVPVSFGTVTDNSGGSGVNNSTIVLQRDQAVLNNNSCGTFPGTFSTTVTLVGGNDTSVSSGYCYRYRQQATDNVGNVGTSPSSNTAMVDAIAPVVPLPTVNGH